jgi:hypothetical protein
VALGFGTLDVGEKHLNVPIAAEASFFGGLANVKRRWMAVVGMFHATVESRKLGEDRYNSGGLILDLILLDETTVPANAVGDSDLGAGLKLVVEPGRHATLPSIRTELRFLALSVP